MQFVLSRYRNIEALSRGGRRWLRARKGVSMKIKILLLSAAALAMTALAADAASLG